MPELPEVETTCRGLQPIVGARVLKVIVREPRLRWPVPSEVSLLEGECIEGLSRRAKYLLLRVQRGTLLLHLGMSGSLRLVPAPTPWRKHDHVAIELADGMQVRLHDPRRFGAVLWAGEAPLDHGLLRNLGPEPLGAEFNASRLREMLRGRRSAIKQALMDASVVVGVGNIYANEALFMAGIHPEARCDRVGLPRLQTLVECVRRVLRASIRSGGTTLRDFLNDKGEPGYFKQSLRVYDREGQPCRRCEGGVVTRRVQGQRATYFCPRCQRR